jgi:hypothetical protein
MAMLKENLPALVDPIEDVANRFTGVIQKVVDCANVYERSLKDGLPLVIPVLDLLYLPTRNDCLMALKLKPAKEACRKYGITEKLFFRLYDKIAPSILRTVYKGLLTDDFSGFRDLPQRFAQASFELHMLPPCGNPPPIKLLRTLDEDNLRRFEWVRGHLITAFQDALKKEIEKNHGGLARVQEEYVGARSSAPFLNQMFNKMPDRKANSMAHLIEMAGYDLEDPEILRCVLFQPK